MEVTLGGMIANVDIRYEGQRYVNAVGTEEGRRLYRVLLAEVELGGPRHLG